MSLWGTFYFRTTTESSGRASCLGVWDPPWKKACFPLLVFQEQPCLYSGCSQLGISSNHPQTAETALEDPSSALSSQVKSLTVASDCSSGILYPLLASEGTCTPTRAHVCTYTRTHTHTQRNTQLKVTSYSNIHAFIYHPSFDKNRHVHTHIHTCTYTCIHTYTHACIHTRTPILQAS